MNRLFKMWSEDRPESFVLASDYKEAAIKYTLRYQNPKDVKGELVYNFIE